MRHSIAQWFLLFYCLIHLTGCIKEEEYANDPQGNFDQLWKIIDEKYCFLNYKQIDWDAIRVRFQRRIYPTMSDTELFTRLKNMLYELQDGHVSLSTDTDVSYYDFWTDSPRNFSETLVESNYLGRNYRQTGGMKYRILTDNIGYIYYESFQNAMDNENLDEIFTHFSTCKGLIIDVRQNSGGNALNAARIASRFTNEKILTGYICHKTGPGHNDFSEPYAIYLKPSTGIRWQKPVAVLTNRYSYSATNDFVNRMKCLPNVTIIGDYTGGGSGMHFTSELPNGWTVRFSASPHFDREMNHIEWGIAPDIKVNISAEDEQRNRDTIIEKAREHLK